MQREPPLTPKSKRANRPTPVTPDRSGGMTLDSLPTVRVGHSTHRSTMAPGDFVTPAPGLFGRRRLPSSRQSMMPMSITQSCPDITRKPEIENKDLEMKFLYDKYLQSKMIELLMKKKKEETKETLVSQIEKLAKEEEAIDKKLMSMRIKEKDIQNLTELQNNLDTQVTEITTCLGDVNKNSVNILSELQNVLRSLDMLQCKNVVVPRTQEDIKRITDYLVECSNLLQSINSFIGRKRDNISIVNVALKDFAEAYVDTQAYMEKIEEALSNVQTQMLMEASHSLSQNEP